MPKTYEKADFEYYLLKDKGVSMATATQYMCQINNFVKAGGLKGYDADMIESIRAFCCQGNKPFAQFAIKALLLYLGYERVWKKYYTLYGRKNRQKDRKVTNKGLTLDEVKALISKLPADAAMAARMQFETAARAAEVLNIRKPDCRLTDDGYLDISITAKGNRKDIVVISDTDLVVAIMKTLARKPSNAKLFNFSYEWYKQRIKAAGIIALKRDNITTHWLRHSRALMIYYATHDPLQVKEALRHQKLENTYQYLKSCGLISRDILLRHKINWNE